MDNSPVGKFWLLLPWALLALGPPVFVYWMLEPVPLVINYIAPVFLSRPAADRQDAATVYVTETIGGVTLWRYVEFCINKKYDGISHRAWVSKSIVWHAPDLPTMMSRQEGCGAVNLSVEVPQSSPTRDFVFTQWMEIDMNPIRTERVEYTPIPLTILAPPAECKK